MKKIALLAIVVAFMNCKHHTENKELDITKEDVATKSMEVSKEEPITKQSIYQFKVKDLYGNDFDFASLKGKKVMIVNTASECGNTPQYKNLQEIYEKFSSNNFTIVGFPANNFGGQEPGSNNQIAAFCKENYGVTFPMMSKISVKGEDMNEVYHFLTEKKRNGYQDSEVEWNFQKYLIDENGYLVGIISNKTLPTDESVISWIKS